MFAGVLLLAELLRAGALRQGFKGAAWALRCPLCRPEAPALESVVQLITSDGAVLDGASGLIMGIEDAPALA